jgi:hypothetical protein
MDLPVRTATELMEAAFEGQWAERRAAVFRRVLGLFLERGGPVSPEALIATLSGHAPTAVTDALRRLHAADVVLLRKGVVELAYPFATGLNRFAVTLGDGRVRYPCCAIDALGLAPMLGTRAHGSRDLPRKRPTPGLRGHSGGTRSGGGRLGRPAPRCGRASLWHALSDPELLPVGRPRPGPVEGPTRRPRGGGHGRGLFVLGRRIFDDFLP